MIAPFYVEFNNECYSDDAYIIVLNMLQGSFPVYAAPFIENKTLEDIEIELENK